MNLINLFVGSVVIIAASSFATGCALDSDMPTPTKEIVHVAPPEGTIVVPPVESPVEPKVGSVKIFDYDTDGHASRIVTAGTGKWERFVAYYVCAGAEEDVLVERVTIEAGSDLPMDNADFASVAVRSYSDILGIGTLSAGTSGKVSIALSKPILAPKGGTCTPMQFVAKISPVVASSTVGGATTGVCRSGHAPALGLAKKDATTLDIDAVGATSGKKIVASVGEFVHRGQPMVIRKSQPIITKQDLSSTTLANIDQDLFKFQVAADSAGPVAVKQFAFSMKIKDAQLCNFRLRLGGSDIDPSMVKIVAHWPPEDGEYDIGDGTGICPIADQDVTVTVAPETLKSLTNVFTLHATVSATKTGSSVSISFLRGTDMGVVTAGISTVKSHVELMPSKLGWRYGIVWSDLSEVPHSEKSIDWTNDVLVNDLTGSVTLTK